jgi:hypothetical protein
VPGAAGLIGAVCSFDYARAGEAGDCLGRPGRSEELVSVLVNDALALLAGLDVD